ncbi:YbaN family protein [Rhizobium cauense]|uniref:YbaN family protein n=1 Tax=Rhizobium cauense TaxID=1166683 RepID=UPI001C6DD9A8|nr:YbaN family protein [Rhizobium cauense]MBW9118106.1 YbaN family protein [Rhizobium cauense]
MRAICFAIGILLTAIGIVGVFVPLLPTTVFLISAAWLFKKSSPRFERYLLQHRVFGPAIHNWRKNGAIARGAKLTAVCGMTAGYLIFFFASDPNTLVAVLVAIALGCSALYVISRPSYDN